MTEGAGNPLRNALAHYRQYALQKVLNSRQLFMRLFLTQGLGANPPFKLDRSKKAWQKCKISPATNSEVWAIVGLEVRGMGAAAQDDTLAASATTDKSLCKALPLRKPWPGFRRGQKQQPERVVGKRVGRVNLGLQGHDGRTWEGLQAKKNLDLT